MSSLMGSPVAGKHALVTGGGRGIGLAAAKALAERGARVSVIGRTVLRSEDAADFFRSEADVTNPAQLTYALDECRAANGPIAILVNNSGVAESAPLVRTTDDMWSRIVATNLTGTFLCMRAVAKEMIDAKWGRIVNIASMAGLEGAPYISAYCASKFGVIGLTKSVAAEYATTGVTVNAVCPGYVETDMAGAAIANIVRITKVSEEQARAQLAAMNPSGRLVTAEEVARAVLHLCESDETGETPLIG